MNPEQDYYTERAFPLCQDRLVEALNRQTLDYAPQYLYLPGEQKDSVLIQGFFSYNGTNLPQEFISIAFDREGRILGHRMADFQVIGDTATTEHSIMVSPESRGKGVSTALELAALDTMSRLATRVGPIEWSVVNGNLVSLETLKAAGRYLINLPDLTDEQTRDLHIIQEQIHSYTHQQERWQQLFFKRLGFDKRDFTKVVDGSHIGSEDIEGTYLLERLETNTGELIPVSEEPCDPPQGFNPDQLLNKLVAL